MAGNILERYGSYSKKKGKRHIRPNNLNFFKKSYGWLSWKMERVGGFLFHAPYAKA